MIQIKIHSDSEEKISVILSGADMKNLHITYDELDYSNIETRRAIWTILDEAEKALGRRVNIDNRLLIQVIPGDEGGCCFCFTQLPEDVDTRKKRLIMKKEGDPLLFKAFCVNSFIDVVNYLKKNNSYTREFSFYKQNNSYFAVIYPQVGSSRRLLFTLSEFGEISTPPKSEIGKITEFGEKILLNEEKK